MSINNVARKLTQTPRSQHVGVRDLLNKVRLSSYNAMVVKAFAEEVWNSKHGLDGPNGTSNTTDENLFNVPSPTRLSRSMEAGHIKVPARGCKTFVRYAS